MSPRVIVQGCMLLCVFALVYSMFDLSSRIEIFLASYLSLAIFGFIWVTLWLISYFMKLKQKRIDRRRS